MNGLVSNGVLKDVRVKTVLRLMDIQSRMPGHAFVFRDEAFRRAGLDPHGPSPYQFYAKSPVVSER